MNKTLLLTACLFSSTVFAQNASSLQPIPKDAKPVEATKPVAPPIDESLQYDRRNTGRLNLSNREFKATVKEQQKRESRMSVDNSILPKGIASNPVPDQTPAPPLKTLSQANSAGFNPAAKPVPDAPPVKRDYSALVWSSVVFVVVLAIGGVAALRSRRKRNLDGTD